MPMLNTSRQTIPMTRRIITESEDSVAFFNPAAQAPGGKPIEIRPGSADRWQWMAVRNSIDTGSETSANLDFEINGSIELHRMNSRVYFGPDSDDTFNGSIVDSDRDGCE